MAFVVRFANASEEARHNLMFHFERVARSWRTPLFLSFYLSAFAREELAERTCALLIEAQTAGPVRRQQILDEVVTSHLWLAENSPDSSCIAERTRRTLSRSRTPGLSRHACASIRTRARSWDSRTDHHGGAEAALS